MDLKKDYTTPLGQLIEKYEERFENQVNDQTFKRYAIEDIKQFFGEDTLAVEDAGIMDFRFHDLRHTFANHLVMNGTTIKDVMEILEHKDTKMTNRYAHLSPEHKQKAVSLLDRLTAPKTEWSQNGHISENAKCVHFVTG